jgi:hypothetical protein
MLDRSPGNRGTKPEPLLPAAAACWGLSLNMVPHRDPRLQPASCLHQGMGDVLYTHQDPTGESLRSPRHPREELDKTCECQKLQKSEPSKSQNRTQKPVLTLEAVSPNADLDVSGCVCEQRQADRERDRQTAEGA